MKSIFTLLFTALAALVVSVGTGLNPVLSFAGMFALSLVMPRQATGYAFETISVAQARGVYTDALIAVFRERIPVTSFLRSFFNVRTTMTKLVSIEVQRGTERVAVDVIRGTNGNRNKSTLSTLKAFLPPYYDEYFNANELDVYDRAIGSTDPQAMIMLAQESATELVLLRDKIERALELQCAQVFETGIITLVNGDNIDFKRKAASLVAYSAGINWADNAVSPYVTLESGATFLRESGNATGSNFNVILGGECLSAFLGNTIVQNRADIKNFGLDNIQSPIKNATGASYHGRVAQGSFTFDLWTYPGQYEDSNSDMQYYWNQKKVCVLPEVTQFEIAYALVPQLIGTGQPQTGPYLVQDFIDTRQTAHEIHLKSAPIAIPVSVDKMYTAQVIAS